ncbi:hypothetical protein AVEN_135919-1 [Araneus ventricosus]|uniref:Uncharacterized protein n=1 Tax=Araneus ventricosus TaxID=182803 RepID=A0A4Y2N1V9_ARAVE|nr:hypothetical protein AVEN_135919-1 [Araneus ventricosus]
MRRTPMNRSISVHAHISLVNIITVQPKQISSPLHSWQQRVGDPKKNENKLVTMATKSTRSKTDIYLLGSTITELTGSKLPSIGMALGLFLHHHIELNKTIRESSTTTIEEITKLWQKARIPVQELRNCQSKLEKLFEQWRLLKKNKNRNTLTQKSKEGEFVSKLNNIFDIAHATALNMIKISQDKEFLLAQCEKGRRGSTLGVDKRLQKMQKMADFRKNASLKRCQQMKKM